MFSLSLFFSPWERRVRLSQPQIPAGNLSRDGFALSLAWGVGLGVAATQAEGHPTPHRAIPEVLSLSTSFPSKILIFPSGGLWDERFGYGNAGNTAGQPGRCARGNPVQGALLPEREGNPAKKLLSSCLLGGK